MSNECFTCKSKREFLILLVVNHFCINMLNNKLVIKRITVSFKHDFIRAGFLNHKFMDPWKLLAKFYVFKLMFIFSEERIHSSVHSINKNVCDHNKTGKHCVRERNEPEKSGFTLNFLGINLNIFKR